MELTLQSLKEHRQEFLDAGYSLPEFDYEKVMENTKNRPTWVHFGAGNIFRAFQANVVQNLLNEGVIDTGLIAAEGFDYEIVEKMSKADMLKICEEISKKNAKIRELDAFLENLDLNSVEVMVSLDDKTFLSALHKDLAFFLDISDKKILNYYYISLFLLS